MKVGADFLNGLRGQPQMWVVRLVHLPLEGFLSDQEGVYLPRVQFATVPHLKLLDRHSVHRTGQMLLEYFESLQKQNLKKLVKNLEM